MKPGSIPCCHLPKPHSCNQRAANVTPRIRQPHPSLTPPSLLRPAQPYPSHSTTRDSVVTTPGTAKPPSSKPDQPPRARKPHLTFDLPTTTPPLTNPTLTNPTLTLKMNRLFGSSGPKPPKATLHSAISNIDTRVSSIDVKLAALTAELTGYQTKLSKMRDGPGKTALKQKALKVLQRRKQYEAQRDQLQSQVWNMEQAQTMQDNLKNTMVTVDALRSTNKALRKEYGKVDVDKIERLQDEMADLLDVGNEIQESLARSYDVPEDVDEAELDAELEALGQEVDMEREFGGVEGAVPSFMQDEVPEFIDEAPKAGGKVQEVAR